MKTASPASMSTFTPGRQSSCPALPLTMTPFGVAFALPGLRPRGAFFLGFASSSEAYSLSASEAEEADVGATLASSSS